MRDYYRDLGYYAFRTRDDQSVCDVVAIRDAYFPKGNGPWATVILAEVKSNREGGPFMNFRAADREALRSTAEKAGAEAVLIYWPPRKTMRVIPSSEWPKPRRKPHMDSEGQEEAA